MKKQHAETYNKAFDMILSEEEKEAEKKKTTSKYEEKLRKVRSMIEIQEKSVKNLQKTGSESTEAGEFIYNNYQFIDDILKELRKAREKYSWKEIKEKLKDHKVIKEIREKEGKIVVEI